MPVLGKTIKMLSKFCLAAALVAVASAGNDEYVNMQSANTGAAADAAGQGSYPTQQTPTPCRAALVFLCNVDMD